MQTLSIDIETYPSAVFINMPSRRILKYSFSATAPMAPM